MKNTKDKLKNQSKVVKPSFQQVDVASSLSRTQASLVLHSFIATFPGSNITKYSGLNTVAKYMNRQYIVKSLSSSFHTEWHNPTKFGVNHVLMAITLASISGISRICRIAAFCFLSIIRMLKTVT